MQDMESDAEHHASAFEEQEESLVVVLVSSVGCLAFCESLDWWFLIVILIH